MLSLFLNHNQYSVSIIKIELKLNKESNRQEINALITTKIFDMEMSETRKERKTTGTKGMLHSNTVKVTLKNVSVLYTKFTPVFRDLLIE